MCTCHYPIAVSFAFILLFWIDVFIKFNGGQANILRVLDRNVLINLGSEDLHLGCGYQFPSSASRHLFGGHVTLQKDLQKILPQVDVLLFSEWHLFFASSLTVVLCLTVLQECCYEHKCGTMYVLFACKYIWWCENCGGERAWSVISLFFRLFFLSNSSEALLNKAAVKKK